MGFLRSFKFLWSFRRIAYLTVCILGVVLLCYGLITLRGTSLVVALVVSGLLVLAGLGKLAFDAAVERSIKLQDSDRLAEEIRRLRTRESMLERELEAVRASKVKVLNVQPILELGLIEADCQISRCFELLYEKDDNLIAPGTPEYEADGFWDTTKTLFEALFDGLTKSWRKVFIGTLIMRFTAKYGINIKKLKVKRDDTKRILYIAGAELEFLGTKDFPESIWKNSLVLRMEPDNRLVADKETAYLEAASKDHCRALMEASLKQGPEELEWLKVPIINTVKQIPSGDCFPSRLRRTGS